MRLRHFAFSLAGAAFVAVLSAAPARAESVTIDSSNCNSSGGNCYGLAWTLSVNSGSFSYGADTYGYIATLSVTDDPLLSGTGSYTISAVDFKVTSSVSSAVLDITSPAPVTSLSNTNLSSWSTTTNGLSSGGCTGGGSGFVCSSTSDATSFAALTYPNVSALWVWYFNSSDALFTNLSGAHIGAKMTDLTDPGRLLSASYTVPEPGTRSLLGAGLVSLLAFRRRLA
jgi:hypothetical protein